MITQLEKVELLTRNKMRKFLFLLILITTKSCLSQTSLFDRKKWLASSDYRYEISKSENFPDFRGKSKKYVKRTLGKPDEVNDEIFIYCLDLNSVKYYDNKLKRKVCDCKASFVSINFKIDERFRTTFSWVEPLEKK